MNTQEIDILDIIVFVDTTSYNYIRWTIKKLLFFHPKIPTEKPLVVITINILIDSVRRKNNNGFIQ